MHFDNVLMDFFSSAGESFSFLKVWTVAAGDYLYMDAYILCIMYGGISLQ